MWKHTPTNTSVRPGKGWTDEDGIQHPGNWHVWSAEEKSSRGLIEITEETPPDSRLYHWGQNPDGSIAKTPKPLEDIKEYLKADITDQLSVRLSKSDWMFIRQMDTGKPTALEVKAERDADRDLAAAAELAIDATATFEELEALVSQGPLVSWPVEVQ